MSTTVTVRALERADRGQWGALWSGYLAFYRARIPEAVTEATFARLCACQDGMLGLAAVDAQGSLAGFAHLILHSSTWSTTVYCYLEDLYVDPSHRGAGTSELLFAAVYEEARKQGAERVYWHTQAFNGRARSLYDTVGRLTSHVVYEHPLGPER